MCAKKSLGPRHFNLIMSPTANNVNVNSSRDPWTYSVRKAVEDIVKNWPFETNMTNHVITQGPRKNVEIGGGEEHQ